MDEEGKVNPIMDKFRKELRGLELDKTIETFGPLEDALGKQAILVQVAYTLQDSEGRKVEVSDRGKRYIDLFEDHLVFETEDGEDGEEDDDDLQGTFY